MQKFMKLTLACAIAFGTLSLAMPPVIESPLIEAEAAKTYTLTFNANGGTCSTKSKKLKSGYKYGTLPTPKRTGYTFLGWYTAKTGGSKVSSSTKMSAKNRTLYARWTLATYTLTYNANGGTCSTKTKKIKYGSTYGTLPTPSRSGYSFAGWYTASSGGSKVYTSTKMTGNRTIYARWTANTYTVQFNGNDGSRSMSKISMTYGTSKMLPANSFTFKGLTFQGWNTKADGTGTSYGNKSTIKNLTTSNKGTVTLYAQWGLSATQTKYIQDKLISMANKERSVKCTANSKLQKSTLIRAKELVSYFSHSRKNGKSWAETITSSGVSSKNNSLGENLARTSTYIRFKGYSVNIGGTVTIGNDTAEITNETLDKFAKNIQDSWLASSAHKKVMTNTVYRYTGVSCYSNYVNGRLTVYACAHFTKNV